MSQLQILQLKSHDDYKACERIQSTVWGSVGVSSEILNVAARYGGAVIGAFVGGGLAGFIYAFLARRNGRLIHWSSMMGVLPRYRDRGLGFRMKLAHRELALRQGLRSICWTYDPLQSRNATLNISRLGARVEEYVQEYYGHFPSAIEKGLPSDRFVVNWHIASPAVERGLKSRESKPPDLSLPRVNETRWNAQGFLENREITFSPRFSRFLVEIPANTDEMRDQSLALARRWRIETRKIFERCLRAGCRVEDFVPPSQLSGGRCFYVLRRQGRKAPFFS